jgi:tetraacyldisaccharide 4'-kinase
MTMLDALYARAARARRRAWERPGRQRRLARPVVSIGNLRVGGTGKTPVVACVVRYLLGLGHRPAVLSRGYGRRRPGTDPVVVSDGTSLRADLARSGDEPLMLARAIPGARVVVCADRYRGGQLAEAELGATCHVLDDGFQHLALGRDVDLVVVTPEDVRDGRTLPGGRLRESLDTAGRADALLVPDADGTAVASVAAQLRVDRVFGVRRHLGRGRVFDAAGGTVPFDPPGPVFLVAGIARPQRFFDDARRAGYEVVGRMAFRDHHAFAARDVSAFSLAARQAGAAAILTTEKDLVRLLAFRPTAIPLAWLPLEAVVEPWDDFRTWLSARLFGCTPARAVREDQP